MHSAASVSRWAEARDDRSQPASIDLLHSFLRISEEQRRIRAPILLTDLVNCYSNINPERPTERLPIERQTKLEYQPRSPLIRLMRKHLDDIDFAIDLIVDNQRILGDGTPRYPDEVKRLLINCKKLVLDDRKRAQERNAQSIIRCFGWDLP